jgi:hypothetical protein
MFVQKINTLLAIVFTLSILNACNDGGEVITLPNDGDKMENPHGTVDMKNSNEKMHIVKVNEVLPTSKYVYLNVSEGDEVFWIAATKQDANVGDSYAYKGGIMKRNFESKEYNRVFDVVYLVTNLVTVEKNGQLSGGQIETDAASENEKMAEVTEVIEHEGSMKIAELVKDPKKYEGKTVQLTGKVMKINPNIMSKNWVHLQDGSKNDYDLVITTNSFIPEGSVVTLQGVVALNLDFGAGYKYDLLVENASLVK